METMTDRPSRVILGKRYDLHEPLGMGGMGTVFRASDLLTGKLVALKQVAIPIDQIMHAGRAGPASHDLALAQEFQHFLGLAQQVIDQARRRVFEEESVPNEEKLFSLFEPHTELLKRGKAGKDIEFGHMIQIQQVREKFITDYEVYEKKPVEHTLLEVALASHRELFGSAWYCA